MKLTLHQGASTLGGNCVEIGTDEESILLDAGTPVNADPVITPDIFSHIAGRAKAIFISHPHPDHYALLATSAYEGPIYMSRGCKLILESTHLFGQTTFDPAAAIPFNGSSISISVSSRGKESVLIVKAIPVDHSGYGSAAFLITTGDIQILYSGDFRNHGRKPFSLDDLMSHLSGPPDYLIMEGTLLNRDYDGPRSEQQLEEVLATHFSSAEKGVLINFSSQNIDRLVGVWLACVRSGKKLVVDPYTAHILNSLRYEDNKLPQYTHENVGVLFAWDGNTVKMGEEIFRYRPAKVTKDMIRKHPEKYVIKTNSYIEHRAKLNDVISSSDLIYSMWNGYARNLWKEERVKHVHCSGHAQVDTLHELVKVVNPMNIIPIHTETPDYFNKSWGDRVLRLKNGESLELRP